MVEKKGTRLSSYPGSSGFGFCHDFLRTYSSCFQLVVLGDAGGIYGQRYDQNGIQVGNEFQVNTYTTSTQWYPSITALSDGGFVVVWESDGQDGDQKGIFR